jgi:hypothetical protein
MPPIDRKFYCALLDLWGVASHSLAASAYTLPALHDDPTRAILASTSPCWTWVCQLRRLWLDSGSWAAHRAIIGPSLHSRVDEPMPAWRVARQVSLGCPDSFDAALGSGSLKRLTCPSCWQCRSTCSHPRELTSPLFYWPNLGLKSGGGLLIGSEVCSSDCRRDDTKAAGWSRWGTSTALHRLQDSTVNRASSGLSRLTEERKK